MTKKEFDNDEYPITYVFAINPVTFWIENCREN